MSCCHSDLGTVMESIHDKSDNKHVHAQQVYTNAFPFDLSASQCKMPQAG